MQITRRQFISYMSTAAAALGLSELQLSKLTEAMAKVGGGPRVLWLQGQPCNGCTVATAQLFHAVSPEAAGVGIAPDGTIRNAYNAALPGLGDTIKKYLDGGLDGQTGASASTADISDVLLDVIDLNYHQTLMSAAGYLSTDSLLAESPGFVLAIEGSIPDDASHKIGADACHIGTSSTAEVTMAAAVRLLAPKSAAVICVGQCASFGNWPAARNQKWEAHKLAGQPDKYRPSNAMSVPDFLAVNSPSTPYVRVSGCPLRAEEMYLVVAQALANLNTLVASFDSWNRPKQLFGVDLYNKPIHNRCVNKVDFVNGRFATEWGENVPGSVNGGCLAKLNCKGPSSWRSCQRNMGTQAAPVFKGTWEALNPSGASTLYPGTSCISAGAGCMACGEPGYPDRFSHPLVKYTGYNRSY
jgi:hydrogenase small subunit